MKNEPIFWVETYGRNHFWAKQSIATSFGIARYVLRRRLSTQPKLRHRIKFQVYADIG